MYVVGTQKHTHHIRLAGGTLTHSHTELRLRTKFKAKTRKPPSFLREVGHSLLDHDFCPHCPHPKQPPCPPPLALMQTKVCHFCAFSSSTEASDQLYGTHDRTGTLHSQPCFSHPHQQRLLTAEFKCDFKLCPSWRNGIFDCWLLVTHTRFPLFPSRTFEPPRQEIFGWPASPAPAQRSPRSGRTRG